MKAKMKTNVRKGSVQGHAFYVSGPAGPFFLSFLFIYFLFFLYPPHFHLLDNQAVHKFRFLFEF